MSHDALLLRISQVEGELNSDFAHFGVSAWTRRVSVYAGQRLAQG